MEAALAEFGFSAPGGYADVHDLTDDTTLLQLVGPRTFHICAALAPWRQMVGD